MDELSEAYRNFLGIMMYHRDANIVRCRITRPTFYRDISIAVARA